MSPSQDYQEVLTEARSKVEEGLAISDEIMNEIATSAPGELSTRLTTVLSRKGKRVRSTLMFLLARTSSEGADSVDLRRVASGAASIEMLHLASLLHDDVIDETDIRRGKPTAHSQWGNSMAILVGDYALSKALELVVSDPDNRVPTYVSVASSKLVAGEVLELDHTGTCLTLSKYYEIIDGKTAALIEAAAACGAIYGGHDESTVKACAAMGRDFGIAFQIIDDLLDFGIGATHLDKALYTDLANDVMTLPMILFYDQCSDEAAAQMDQLRKQAGSVEIQEQIVEIFKTAGVFEKTKTMAMKHVEDALGVLASLPDGEGKTSLIQMCGTMAFRSK